jgi:hypothetical protein
MRTTLTLDDDVAVALEQLRARKDYTLKQAVNEAIRRGIRAMNEPSPSSAPYSTPTISLGRCLLGSLDDVSEALAVAEGEGFR